MIKRLITIIQTGQQFSHLHYVTKLTKEIDDTHYSRPIEYNTDEAFVEFEEKNENYLFLGENGAASKYDRCHRM